MQINNPPVYTHTLSHKLTDKYRPYSLIKKMKDSTTVYELLLMLHKCLTEHYNTHVHSCSF